MNDDNDDNLTLTPEYRFEFDSGLTRETTDPDFTSSPNGASPDAIEYLATLAREDPDCDVHLIGMGG